MLRQATDAGCTYVWYVMSGARQHHAHYCYFTSPHVNYLDQAATSACASLHMQLLKTAPVSPLPCPRAVPGNFEQRQEHRRQLQPNNLGMDSLAFDLP